MFRTLIVEFLLPLLLFLLLRNMLRGFLSAGPPRSARQPQPPPVSPGGELKRDPVCGTYVSTATAVQERVKGEVVYFCSKECRDRYKLEAKR
jgi:YHS domain-containing protein